MYENDASHLPQELSTFASIGWTDNKGVPTTPQIWFRRADPMDEDERLLKSSHSCVNCIRNAYGTDAGLDAAVLLADA